MTSARRSRRRNFPRRPWRSSAKWSIPTIRIEPPSDQRAFADLVRDAHAYDWLIFTSPNGVEAFFQTFYRLYNDAREIGGVRIAAIGPATAAKLREYHLAVDLQPAEFVAEAVIDALQTHGSVENQRILLARAEQARDVLPRELSRLGAIVDLAVAYRTVAETEDRTGARERFRAEGADLITFTSSSTVEHFIALNLPLPEKLRTASIGPITSATMRALGLRIDLEAPQHDIPGLVDAIVRFYAGPARPA
jgi:uroporphyrinogen III methyltransferase/synthase